MASPQFQVTQKSHYSSFWLQWPPGLASTPLAPGGAAPPPDPDPPCLLGPCQASFYSFSVPLPGAPSDPARPAALIPRGSRHWMGPAPRKGPGPHLPHQPGSGRRGPSPEQPRQGSGLNFFLFQCPFYGRA